MTEETIEVPKTELNDLIEEKVESKLEEERQKKVTMSRRGLLASAAGIAGAGALVGGTAGTAVATSPEASIPQGSV